MVKLDLSPVELDNLTEEITRCALRGFFGDPTGFVRADSRTKSAEAKVWEYLAGLCVVRTPADADALNALPVVSADTK